MAIEAYTTNDYKFIIDEEDKDLLNFVWSFISNGYIRRTIKSVKDDLHVVIGRRKGIYLPFDIDHKDRNTLNNTRENLSCATRSQNFMNKGLQSTNTSGYKGVSYTPRVNKYRAYISIRSIQTHLGYYDTAIEAALRYNMAAKILFKEFACLNVIKEYPINDTRKGKN